MPIIDPCVIRLMAEGASIEIFGHKETDGCWRFIGRGMNMEIEDDGNDAVHVDGIPWCRDLSAALPEGFWIKFIPMHVHPELRGWFRDRYEAAVASLPAYQREMHGEYRHRKWQALFESTPPDRWSEADAF